MKAKSTIKSVMNLGIVIVLAFLISGCAMLDSNKSNGTQGSGTIPKSKKTTAVYYDFEDVLIPMELSVVKDRTVVILTPGFISGIITLKGRLERRSLFNFFSNNMQKDNWSVVSQIKSPGTTIMVFQKASRTCVISIRDEQIYTWVEIGVAPTVTGNAELSESSLMN